MSTQVKDITTDIDAAADPGASAPASAPTAGPANAAPAAGETRTYRASSVEELIPRIQAELGPDAIVVRREKGLTGGVGGFFQRPFVEVEARAGTPRVDRYDADGAAPALPPALEQADLTEPPATAEEAFRELTPAALVQDVALQEPNLGVPEAAFAAALAQAQAHAELPDIEPAVIAPAVIAPAPLAPPPAAAAPIAVAPPAVAPPAAAAPRTSLPRGRARMRVEESLLGHGIREAFVGELIETAATHLLPVMPARTSLARAVHRALCQRIPAGATLPTTGAAVALAGPGGSGKSACCAALVDAYRTRGALPATCAAIATGQGRDDLLATLAPQLPQPLALAAPELTRALRAARAEGLLLLDLPALSPADRSAIRAQAALLQTLKPDRVIIALPATLAARAAAQLLEALAPLGAGALAITHADETDQLGIAVEVACRLGLAPEYLLDRGRGRTALTQIDPAYLADRLLS